MGKHSKTVVVFTLSVLSLLLISCGSTGSGSSTTDDNTDDPANPDLGSIEARNAAIGRGINLSGLEQPFEGAWNYVLDINSLAIIKQAGFDSVRIPIRWSAHAAELGGDDAGRFAIDPAFFDRVDAVVNEAKRVGLKTIINMHLYDALLKNPDAHENRFIDLWDQIARHYSQRSDSLYFEVLNEPDGAFVTEPEKWNALFARALTTIRNSNPTRAVIVGPVSWNLIEYLPDLQLPADSNLIVSIHYYDRGEFTHQGATWVEPRFPTGVTWRAETMRLASGLQNWSWDTTTTATEDALNVQFSVSGAAFNVFSPNFNGVQRLSVELRGDGQNLTVLCGNADVFNETGATISPSSNFTLATVDLTACPANTNQIAIQNLSENVPAIELRGGEICDANACRPLIHSESDAIDAAFAMATQWAKTNNRPLHLGEFGAFEAADMASRARWTTKVQAAAQSRGLSSNYWEFDQGFGAYDRDTSNWHTPLLNALLPR